VRPSADRARLRRFLEQLGRRLRRPVRFYLVGGSVLVDLGLRTATLDVDYVAAADDPRALEDLEGAIRALRTELDINVEPASPADFLPIPPAMLDQSRFLRHDGRLSVYYYHLPSLVIAKVARGLERDLDDGERLLRAGEVRWQDIDATWDRIRSSPTGWLRYEPDDVQQRLETLRRRFETGAS
jgi:hypothetical protein